MIDERARAIARQLTIRYIVWSSIILAASGLLGVVLRWSQSVPQARVGDNFWYAMMTAHGLGAFVGWGAFAVMGLAWWVLAGIGFPVRGFGLAMARLTWWLMVFGVLGVIITTIFMGFAASWVFLYPLPFYGSHETIESLITEIETELTAEGDREFHSHELGRMVMERLAKVDQVAYVRFASVYREFKDVNDFVDELTPMLRQQAGEQ